MRGRNRGASVRLTKRSVEATEPAQKPYRVWDRDLSGFGLKVSPSGVRTYFAWYRLGTGRTAGRREYTLGRHGTITAEQARTEAEQIISQARLGADPQANRAQIRAEMTIGQLCDFYVSEGCATKKALTIYTDAGRIERHIKPLLGGKPVSGVGREDIERFLQDVAAGKTAASKRTVPRGKSVVTGGQGAATRTVGLLGAIFEFAVSRKLRSDNPVRGVKRFRDRRHERFLSQRELGRLGDALAAAATLGANAKGLAIIRLLALTGARRNEIAHLRWQEVDLDRGCLRLADSKTGQKVIPLGTAAVATLSELPRLMGSFYVFPSERDADQPFQGVPKVWLKVRESAGLSDVRLHDLRHSFASVGLVSGQSLPLIGKLLGHTDVGTTQRYAHLADDPVRAAADAISSVVASAMSTAQPQPN